MIYLPDFKNSELHVVHKRSKCLQLVNYYLMEAHGSKYEGLVFVVEKKLKNDEDGSDKAATMLGVNYTKDGIFGKIISALTVKECMISKAGKIGKLEELVLTMFEERFIYGSPLRPPNTHSEVGLYYDLGKFSTEIQSEKMQARYDN
ncbi:unnamed protein product [Arabidopsis halleri]